MSEASTSSSPIKDSPLYISLPRLDRPTLQREYTFSPSKWSDCTPKTSHGFIAMHISTPVEEPHRTRSDGKPASAGDYFSMQKQRQMLSPNPAPYEAHGYLPLCSVAADTEDVANYFANRNGAPTASTGSSEDMGFCTPTSVDTADNDKSKSGLIKRPGDYMSSSHVPRCEPPHSMGSPVVAPDIVTKPENNTRFGSRSGSDTKPREGDCETCDRAEEARTGERADHRRQIVEPSVQRIASRQHQTSEPLDDVRARVYTPCPRSPMPWL